MDEDTIKHMQKIRALVPNDRTDDTWDRPMQQRILDVTDELTESGEDRSLEEILSEARSHVNVYKNLVDEYSKRITDIEQWPSLGNKASIIEQTIPTYRHVVSKYMSARMKVLTLENMIDT